MSFHRDTRGSATVETVAVAPLLLLMILFVADQHDAWVPAQDKVNDLRAAAWGVLRDDAGQADLDSGARRDAPPNHETSVESAASETALGKRVTVELRSEWPRTLPFPRTRGTFHTAIIQGAGTGPDSTPSIPSVLYGF